MSSLYLDYFGLSAPPFSITPDTSFFFEGGNRGAFIAELVHAAQQADGIVLLIGEVGSGKTLLSRLLLARLPDNVDTVYLPNPSFSHDEIIDVIARDLGITSSDQGVRLDVLQYELIKRHALGRQVVVFIDEAHAMPGESIEEVRRLSNLETDDCKLVQLILCGQPELDKLLATPSLRQVRDRVVYRLVLQNLSRDDASSYLDHRLRIAGWRGGRMFSAFGERLLLADARGRVRRINVIADKALLAAYAEGSKQVNARHVRLAIRDVGANFANLKPGKRWQTYAALTLVMAAIAFIWLSFERTYIAGMLSSQPQASRTQSAIAAAPALPGANAKINTPPPTIEISSTSAPAPVDMAPASQAVMPPLDNLDQLVKLSYINAQQQSALGSHAIRIASMRRESDAVAFIKNAAKVLAPEQIYVRQYSVGKSTWYAVYYGNMPTREASDQAIGEIGKKLPRVKPIIRTWKEIHDAPWS